jgi:hypothetical protein
MGLSLKACKDRIPLGVYNDLVDLDVSSAILIGARVEKHFDKPHENAV